MQKTLIIYNPVSGSRKLRNFKALIQKALKDHPHIWHETSPKNNFDQFKSQKFSRIIVVGGDGTVAEVASFIARHKLKTPLAIIPTGSASLLARALKIPTLNINKALKLALTGKPKPLDLIKIGSRYGLIAVGCGYDTHIMHHTTRSLKRRLGFFAYVWSIIKTFFFYKSRPYKITIDGQRHTISAKSIMVFNILPFSDLKLDKFLLGHKINPTDGTLEILALNPKSLLNIFNLKSKIQVFKGKKISIKSKKENKFQIDGDLHKKSRSLQIEVLPKAINIIC